MDDEIPHVLSESDHGPRGGVPQLGAASQALRDVLTLSGLARVALARRLGMSVHDVEAMEHVMTSRTLGGDLGSGVGPAELARRLGVTTAAITQSLDRLERAGHVRRVPHPTDGRRRVVEVTASGREAVMAQLGPLLGLLGQEEVQLDPAEQEAVVKYLHGQGRAYRRFLGVPD